MGLKNKIYPEGIYFLTMTVVGWIDVFTRPIYKEIVIDSIKYCQKEKGLVVHAWVIMSNHIHLIASAEDGFHLSNILRDFKKFTSKKIVEQVKTSEESRRSWILRQFEFAGRFNAKIKEYKFWQDGNEAKELITNKFTDQKLDYLHNNPVEAGFVRVPEDYLYSSAIDYCGGKGLIDIIHIE